ncbi:MAG TPA: 30S ribosomal protein S9 [Candidatus Nanoarchaeia archaeon]|nr:30S ribosomal protein S9 [Candidatus Nanoarchaeia archaeon]
MKTINTSGKRKRAIARATLREGKGLIRINNVNIEHYQPTLYRLKLREPLLLAGDAVGSLDIDVRVAGGGIASQSDAARLAIAKALIAHSKNDKLREQFLKYDRTLLVADVRRKETHKPNRHGKARAKVAKSYR